MRVVYQRYRGIPDIVTFGYGTLEECEKLYQKIDEFVGLPYLKAITGNSGKVSKAAVYLGRSGYMEFKPTMLRVSVFEMLANLLVQLHNRVSPNITGFMYDGDNLWLRTQVQDYTIAKLPDDLMIQVVRAISKIQQNIGVVFNMRYCIEYVNDVAAPVWLSQGNMLWCTTEIPCNIKPSRVRKEVKYNGKTASKN